MSARERKTNPAGEPRRRRSAEEARREILDAAGRRLVQGGPEAIRLQEIAGDLGISHPAILHHFGSRDGLIAALDERAIRALTEDVASALAGDPLEAVSASDLIERVAEAMEGHGLAQLIAWWSMRGFEGPGSETIDVPQLIDDVASAILQRAGQDRIGSDHPHFESVVFAIRLAVLATFGDALLGGEISRFTGSEREAERHRFRAWLGELLLKVLPEETGGFRSS
jgi:AcrR family transcriptional regulator